MNRSNRSNRSNTRSNSHNNNSSNAKKNKTHSLPPHHSPSTRLSPLTTSHRSTSTIPHQFDEIDGGGGSNFTPDMNKTINSKSSLTPSIHTLTQKHRRRYRRQSSSLHPTQPTRVWNSDEGKADRDANRNRWSPPQPQHPSMEQFQRHREAMGAGIETEEKERAFIQKKQQERIEQLEADQRRFQSQYPPNNNPLQSPTTSQLNDPSKYQRELDPVDVRRQFGKLANELEGYETQYGHKNAFKRTPIGDEMFSKHRRMEEFKQQMAETDTKFNQFEQNMAQRMKKKGLSDETSQSDPNSKNKNTTNPPQQQIIAGQPKTFPQPPPVMDPKTGLTNKMEPFKTGTTNIEFPSNTPHNAKPSLLNRIKRLSPILQQGPQQMKHLWRTAKAIKSEESLLLFQAEFLQAKKILFSEQNIKRTKLELEERLKFAEKYIDRKLQEPYIEPTTEYRLQQKEVLHDKIIDMHYAQDRIIDKIRAKVNIFAGTINAINTDPRKREILARKILFTSLDNDTTMARIAKVLYFPFGLVLRTVMTAGSVALLTVELLTSKLIPEFALVARTLRRNISDYSLTPNNVVQLIGLMLLATFIATIGHDLAALYTSSVMTPRGTYVDVAHTFLLVNSEEMVYDSIREMVANRLLITPQTYSEMYSPYGQQYFRLGRIFKDKEGEVDIAALNTWGNADRLSRQLSHIQPIFTQMKHELTMLYKDRFFLPLERLNDGLRNHSIGMGFTVEALDGFLDAMYMRDTRTDASSPHDASGNNKIINYLLHEDFLVLPPGDVIRTQAPGEIYHHVVSNFRTLEGKDPTLGGELFKDYVKLGSRVAYRKKLLHEIEMLTEVRQLMENARFPHVTIPQRDIKKIACDLNDPITKAVMAHLEELRLADPTTPLYPSRPARQLLESSYQIDARNTHYSRDSTIVNDHYLLLCNMDNARYSYDTLCNHHNLQFTNGDQRDVFERHIFHLGMVLNKMDAILVQNYIELRHIEHNIINPLNPLEGNVIGLVASDADLKKMGTLPRLQDVVNQKYTLPAHPDHGEEASMMYAKFSKHTDPVEYDRNNYKNLVAERTRELKKQLDFQTHPGQGDDNSWRSQLSHWWYGKPREQPFSDEFESVLHWQATRDVMATLNNDPYLHRRFLYDYGTDQMVKLYQGGYISEKGLDEKMVEGAVIMADSNQASGRTHTGSSKLSFAQSLFAPPGQQDIPSTIDYSHAIGDRTFPRQ